MKRKAPGRLLEQFMRLQRDRKNQREIKFQDWVSVIAGLRNQHGRTGHRDLLQLDS